MMHSNHDESVSFEYAYYAHQQILDSEICLLDSWGHLIWLRQESHNVNEKLVKFLTRYS